jgi:hypothetical protein
MSAETRKKFELAAYVVLLIVSVGIAVRLSRPDKPETPAPQKKMIRRGDKLSGIPVDWATHDWTLMLALQVGCKYCSASAPFYQRLAAAAEQSKKTHLMAIMPQAPPAARKYLESLSVPIADVRQAGLAEVGVTGTPTLALVNRYGMVVSVWYGRLSHSQEADLLHSAGLD